MDLSERIQQATNQAQELRESIQKIREVNNDITLSTFTKDLTKIEKCSIKCRKILKGHQSKIFALQWSEDKTHLTSVSQDSRLLVWEGLTTNKTTVIPLKCPWMMSCSQSPSGNFVAAAGLDNMCSVFNVLSADFPPKPCRELTGHTAFISCCRFLNDRQIITSSADATCILWDLESGSKIKEFIHHDQDVMAVAISPNKEMFISVGCDKTCCLWSLQTGRVERVFKGHTDDINCAQFFPTGQAFITGSDDFTCLLFDIRTEREIMKYQADTIDSAVNSLSLSRSGRLLFTAHDDTACQIWDTLRGEVVGKLGGRNGHQQRVSCVDVSADGYAVATGSWDSNIRIWA